MGEFLRAVQVEPFLQYAVLAGLLASVACGVVGTYVVVRLWDQRRLIVPLQYWVEKPFQNWTRHNAELIGSVFLWVDYRMPLAPLRQALQRACEASANWDRRFCVLQVTEAGESSMQLRALVTASDASKAWDLRCEVREALLDFLQRDYPHYLPRLRAEATVAGEPGSNAAPPEAARAVPAA